MLGVVAAAEFSTLIGLIIAVAVLVVLTRSGRISPMPSRWPCVGARAALAGHPDPAERVPERLRPARSAGSPGCTTCETYFWPTLFSDNNWILGVRPAARVAAPNQAVRLRLDRERLHLAAVGRRHPAAGQLLLRSARRHPEGLGVSRGAPTRPGSPGTAAVVAVCAQLVLMLFDPHLTYRGSGDAFFLLLALVRRLPSVAGGSRMTRLPSTAIASRWGSR